MLFESCNVSSLAWTRIILGILLLLDTIHERGLSWVDIMWSKSMFMDRCRFPLVTLFELPLGPPSIYALYAIQVMGLLGIIFGYHYRISAFIYAFTYWTLFFQDRSRWNNHSYLFGLLSILFLCNDSNRKWSLDVLLKRIPSSDTVEQWQYFLLRFQIFLVYFYAGLKKINPDWLLGYSMVNISEHWIFVPARLVLPSYWIDYWLIHVGGFLLDISVGFLFICSRTRWLAFILCGLFNLINSQLFKIGMFPWVMLAMMPIFSSTDWPLRLLSKGQPPTVHQNELTTCYSRRLEKCHPKGKQHDQNRYECITFCLILTYVLIQISLPFAFLIFGGFNTWTSGIYGYNWDMMVHNWNHLHTQVKVKALDSRTNRTVNKYLNSELWAYNHRWSHNADMAKQFALCVKGKIKTRFHYKQVQVFVDSWTSLNGRFAQRIFEPDVDLVRAPWSPFKTPDWVIPIYKHSNYWRRRLQYNFEDFDQLVKENQRNGSLALFLADRPGGSMSNYIDVGFEQPARLIVFEQMLHVKISSPNGTNKRQFFLKAKDKLDLEPGTITTIYTIGSSESYFALLYPKWSQQQRQSDGKLHTLKNGNIMNGRSALLTSLKFVLIGIKILVWNMFLRPIIDFAFDFWIEANQMM